MGIFDGLLGPPDVEKLEDRKDVEGLIKALRYENWNVRVAAAEVLGKIGDTRAVEPLIQVLKDEYEVIGIRVTAAEVLGKIGDERAAEPLIQVLNDEDRRVQDSVRVQDSTKEALKKIGELAVEPLIQALKNRDSDVREAVAEVLDKLGWKPKNDTEKAHYLIAKIDAYELGELGEPAVKPLIQALKDGDEDVRSNAATALGWIGEPAVESLIQALKDEDWFVRSSVAETLGEIGDARAVESLSQVLKDENSVVS